MEHVRGLQVMILRPKDGTAAPGGSLPATCGYPPLGLATLCQDQAGSAHLGFSP